jgi:hypothetical protein
VRHTKVLAVAAFNVAILMGFVGLALSLPTYAPTAEGTGLWTSVVCGVLACAFVAGSWPLVPRGVRLIGVAAVGMALMGVTYSATRLCGVW